VNLRQLLCGDALTLTHSFATGGITYLLMGRPSAKAPRSAHHSRFNRDDGWAIASHIALSILMSVFSFIIVVTAIAGLVGSVNLANED
jgi:hypothetical protein